MEVLFIFIYLTLISDVSFVPILSIPVQFKVHTEYIS